MSNQSKDKKNSNQNTNDKKQKDESMLKERVFVVNYDETKVNNSKK